MNFNRISVFGKHLNAWTTDDDVLVVGDSYEKHITKHLPRVLERGGGFVDVGAHFGFYMLAVRSTKSDVPVFNFEPSANNWKCIMQTVGELGLRDVCSYCCGLSDVVKTLDYGFDGSAETNSNCSVADLQGTSGHPVMVMPLDVTPVVDVPICCVKIDVEGHEFHVIRGMQRLLKAQTPWVIMEYCPQALAAHGSRPVELLRHMTDLNYEIEVLERDAGMGGRFWDAQRCADYIAAFPSWITELLFVPGM